MRCMFRKEHRSAFFMYRNTNAACRSQAANVFVRHSPTGPTILCSWDFCGGLAPPPRTPGARLGREQDTYGGMRGAVVKNALKYFCKSPRFSAERFAKNFNAACRIRGRQLRRASAIFFPHTPIFPAGGVRVGVWCCVLWLFYSPWANG